MRLLLVDDDAEMCELIEQFLGREQMEVVSVHSGAAGIERCRTGSIDIVVLDVMLPGMDGFDVLRALRRMSNVPVIMLTARGDDIDRIVGLELGADDYLPKPFNPRELVARIRAVLRRHQPTAIPERLSVGDVSIDTGSRDAWCAGQRLELTTLEFEILALLMRAAGRVVTRDRFMEALYGRAAGPFDRAIDMHVSHLRRKLGARAASIKTVRGSGYTFSTVVPNPDSAA